jgi:hypothetical protein
LAVADRGMGHTDMTSRSVAGLSLHKDSYVTVGSIDHFERGYNSKENVKFEHKPLPKVAKWLKQKGFYVDWNTAIEAVTLSDLTEPLASFLRETSNDANASIDNEHLESSTGQDVTPPDAEDGQANSFSRMKNLTTKVQRLG